MARQSLDALLDQCVGDIRSGRKTLAQCLAEHPGERRELEPLLRIATCIVAPLLAPDPARKARARRELVAALQRERQAAQPSWWPLRGLARPAQQWRFSAPALAVLAAVLITTTSAGAAFAAQEAQPGDALYGLKTAIEQVQVATAPSDEAKAQAQLDIAARRLAEVEKALDTGNLEAARVAADGHAKALAEAEAHLAQAADRGQPIDALLARLEANLERERTALKKAADKAADAAQLALEKARARAQRGLERARERAKATSPAAGPGAAAGPERSGTAARGADVQSGSGGPSARAGALVTPTATTIPSFETQLKRIADLVKDLDDEAKGSGEAAQSLKAKLDAANEALARGQQQVALNQLQAFRNQMEALRRSGRLSDESHARLLAGYEDLVASLSAADQGEREGRERQRRDERRGEDRERKREEQGPRADRDDTAGERGRESRERGPSGRDRDRDRDRDDERGRGHDRGPSTPGRGSGRP